MNRKKYRFIAELAGVPIEFQCDYEGNMLFFKDYYSEKEALIICVPSEDEINKMRAFCTWLATHTELGIPESEDVMDIDEEYIELITINSKLTELLIKFGVLQIHGSAICMDDEAYVFLAPSGTGKSTHARLWREVFGTHVYMINDDKPLVRISDEGIMAFGSPWDGKHHLSNNTSARIKAIVILNRDKTNHIEKITGAEAFPFLYRQSHTSDNPENLKTIMSLEQKLLNEVRCYRMGCNMDADAAIVALRGLKDSG